MKIVWPDGRFACRWARIKVEKLKWEEWEEWDGGRGVGDETLRKLQ
jgi:hypothetical protein